MVQVQIEVEEPHAQFLQHYHRYGFSDRDALVRTAIERLRRELESKPLDLAEDTQSLQEFLPYSPRFGGDRDRITLSDDFDAPLDEFQDYS